MKSIWGILQVLVYLTTMAVVYRRVKKCGRKVDLVILHMDIVHLAAVCHSAPLTSATSSRPNLQIINLDELITIDTAWQQYDWFYLICIGGKELGFEGSVTFWYSLLVAVRNPRSSSEEEEEIEIPKSRNSSRTLRTWAAAAKKRINPSRHQARRTFHPSP